MNLTLKHAIFIYALSCISNAIYSQGKVTDLRSEGYIIYPSPQMVDLEKENIILDNSWSISGKKLPTNKTTTSLVQRAKELYDITFSEIASTKQIILRIRNDAVTGISNMDSSDQAYKITIKPDIILIEGNEERGLFYGVQSLLQLAKPLVRNKLQLPVGTITDWPDLELRFIHWDTKHHRDKVETLKRYIDWSAYFKINAIAFEIEDKYEYPTHPIIGSPDAFTKDEMQELTKYAQDRFIQLVPNVQAPAHMAFVLKHKEFEHLKADDESNFQACMCDEEAMDLIFDMYQDMIDATPGVDYFFVSTDEVYYAGICNKCKDEYTIENRSLTWAKYLSRVTKWMEKRNRKVLAWVEYPLLPEHISKVPNSVIDAIMGSHKTPVWVQNENKAGIEQLSYSSIQGAEFLFPNYFATNYRNKEINGRLYDVHGDIKNREADGANLIGTFAAAWDDAGLHNETFWLGWATVSQYGWTKNTPTLQQNIADFMDVFYGYDSPDMVEAYMLLQEGARFYEDLWDKNIVSKERPTSYGNSKGKGVGGENYDLQIQMPPLPSVKDLSVVPSFRTKYDSKIKEASVLVKKNELLTLQLTRNVTRVRHNSYNLEVLLSIASLERYSMNTVINLAKVEDYLVAASKIKDNNATAISLLVEAYKLSGKILKEQERMWEDFTLTWEKSRLPKGKDIGGKIFTHVFDDVKDHFADRRKGLEYMLAPFERTGIEVWRKQLNIVISEFANNNKVSVKGLELERLED
ncbi:glycoside hydrolase family 20 zincin-like fold domain-containing protein [Wocania ichthyoenteri]|uniref:glycoside hydrolase family 20 zincin-like fold domain-containing protein n=1 Tax=Wocania ichthyoenteri TaxID=1230531 RepID=UPI00053EF0EE|nr:glycoside hydrolase family 20 zincin-like fold domain-containing protein [Wocania ichthyoenteri]